jgi:hypothetical protein
MTLRGRFRGQETRLRFGLTQFAEDLVMIQLHDEERRLLYKVLLEQDQEPSSSANTSEIAKRRYKLATRFARLEGDSGSFRHRAKGSDISGSKFKAVITITAAKRVRS